MPGRPALDHVPAPAHPQVAAQHEPAFEAQQEVLADRLDGLEPPPVEPLGDALGRSARMRRLDGHVLADEHLQLPGGAAERVTLWHGRATLAAR